MASVPTAPGVYRLFDELGTLLYIGKAKNLRRRLAQYRKASRLKRGRRMRALIQEAARIEWQLTDTELEAALQELRLIQSLSPKRNIAGAFTFLYPMIGIWQTESVVHFCFTTTPDALPQFTFHGAYRSREITGEGFFALMRLLQFIGHAEPRSRLAVRQIPRYSYIFGFRRLPPACAESWEAFLRGDSRDALQALVFSLLDRPGARAKAAEVQQDVKSVQRFWKKEVAPLRRAIRRDGYLSYPVAPKERDLLFVRVGYLNKEEG